ncbi:Nmad5 family putative nucleotide modification protein [Inquilinus sp. OTU3971]|uniref:Nmad5 family putative nucleotide modification protein n=1 Tax=Inquilinus sp. OTU3971 TaxID=3043855 RepID=UPI00313E0CD7
MAQKLTNTVREEILDKMTKAVFGERQAAVAQREDEIARRFIRLGIGEENWNTYEAVPVSWLNHTKHIIVRIGGGTVRLEVIKHVKVPKGWDHGLTIAQVDGGTELAELYAALRNDRDTLADEIRKFTVDTQVVLQRTHSIKKLIEMWPEVRSYVPEAALADSVPLPVPVGLIAGINAKLPPRKKAA